MVTSVGLILMGLFWVVAFVLKFPTLVLGMLLAPCMSRVQFVIQFLYPTAAGRFVHLLVVRVFLLPYAPIKSERTVYR